MRSVVKVAARMLGIAGMTLALSGCFYPLALKHRETSPDTRPWWCTHLPHQTPHDEHGTEWYRDQGITKGMLSWDDCLAVSQGLQDSLAYALQWPTLADAEAAGFNMIVPYAEGMGTHHTRGAISQTFTPSQPQFLQYDGNGPDAKLVGMSWYVNSGASQPPAGYVGNNDWWHRHEYLCFVGGQVVFDGTCAEGGISTPPGNTVYLGNNWMLHAWIVPGWHFVPDVFMNHHPCLQAGGPAAADDECWHVAAGHDHEH